MGRPVLYYFQQDVLGFAVQYIAVGENVDLPPALVGQDEGDGQAVKFCEILCGGRAAELTAFCAGLPQCFCGQDPLLLLRPGGCPSLPSGSQDRPRKACLLLCTETPPL